MEVKRILISLTSALTLPTSPRISAVAVVSAQQALLLARAAEISFQSGHPGPGVAPDFRVVGEDFADQRDLALDVAGIGKRQAF